MGEHRIERKTAENFSEIRRPLAALKKIDFELACLALLTREGLKPLSRWEKPLEKSQLELLHAMDLQTRQITRTVKTAREVTENIFSRSASSLELYSTRFEGKPIDKSAETQRFEGFLFGYPPCCIEQYVVRPYAANSLSENDQKILFHWACRNCKITPFLLASYRMKFEVLENL